MPAPKRSRATKIAKPPPARRPPPPQKAADHAASPDGPPTEPLRSLEVFCPRAGGRPSPAERCAEWRLFVTSFPNHAGEAGATVECSAARRPGAPRRPPVAADRHGRSRGGARFRWARVSASRARVRHAGDQPREAPVADDRAMPRRASPVVDGAWRPVGIVSKTDLIMNGGSDGSVSERDETRSSHSLPENARLFARDLADGESSPFTKCPSSPKEGRRHRAGSRRSTCLRLDVEADGVLTHGFFARGPGERAGRPGGGEIPWVSSHSRRGIAYFRDKAAGEPP